MKSTYLFTASLLLSTAIVAAYNPTVYIFTSRNPLSTLTSNVNNHRQPSSSWTPPVLNFAEAQVALAHVMDLSGGSSAFLNAQGIDMEGSLQTVFNQPGVGRKGKDVLEGVEANLVLAIKGVEHVEDLMPAFDPSFEIEKNLSGAELDILVGDLGRNIARKDKYTFDAHTMSKSGYAQVNEDLLAELYADVDLTVLDLSKKADALFLEEAVSLNKYVQDYVKERKAKKTSGSSPSSQDQEQLSVTVNGLAAIEVEHGADSQQYKVAQRVLKEYIQKTLLPGFEQAHKTFAVSVVVIEANDFAVSSQPMSKRQDPPVLGAGNNNGCFLTEIDCQTNTNGCSAHGVCTFSPAANCFKCKCGKDEKFTQFGGPLCDKVDISVQFHLFFWLGLGLVTIVALAIGLIVQMGSQSLGGVPVGPTRAQLKRD